MTIKRSEIEPVCSASPLNADAASPVEELAVFYAAGALTDPERIDVERRMAAGDEFLLAEVRSWGEVVGALGTALEPVTPDACIKAALLARMQPERALQSTTIADHTASRIPKQIVHRADGTGWRSAGVPGASVRVLNADRKRGRMTTLMKIDPGCRFPSHAHPGGEECLVISGDMIDGDLTLGPGDYVRTAAGTHHDELTTRTGCVCLIMSFMDLPTSR